MRRRLEAILAYVDEVVPEIILFDCGSRAFDVEQLAHELREKRPHLRARLLGITRQGGESMDDEER